MIVIKNANVAGFEDAIRGMRNPMNSWDRSDSYRSDFIDDGKGGFVIGNNDFELMMKLAKAGSVHAKYRRMITVHLDIIAPLYWWKEFDTYKVGTVANSCSTMHKIHEKEFTLNDFSHEHLRGDGTVILDTIINELNRYRRLYINGFQPVPGDGVGYEPFDKTWWWQMIQLLPSSYNQQRTVMVNYEILAGVYAYRKNHKLDEWCDFCKWIEKLPYSEIITCKQEVQN